LHEVRHMRTQVPVVTCHHATAASEDEPSHRKPFQSGMAGSHQVSMGVHICNRKA
jgi:hypothetical protein